MKIKNILNAAKVEKESRKTHQLYTVWGEKLDPEHVLTEYPRPGLRRDNYTVLNGYWNYAITGAESECPERWDGRILVPFSPESALSGVGRQLKPQETLWYERVFTLPEKSEGKKERTILHFGAVDQSCVVYVNGVRTGNHEGGYLSFSLDITDQIKPGENRIVVKVRDVSDTSWHSRGKQRLKSGGIFYTAQSGIWQTVWMEQVPQRYIRNLRITPRYDEKSVEICVEMNDDGNDESVNSEIRICAGGQEIFNGRITGSCAVIPVSKMYSWTPETPFLYDVAVTAGEDKAVSYFAMRIFTREKDETGTVRLCLNHRPYFMNGVLDQGYWPDGLMTAPSDEAMIYDIQTAKSLGFNLLRKHCKLEPMRWYYHCDRLGMIVWQDMVNGGTDYHMGAVCYLPTVFPGLRIRDHHYRLFSRQDREGREEWRRECAETVRGLYHFPCIAAWVVFNEGWGQFDSESGVELIRSLDSTRLIDEASGWFDQKGGDMRSVHNYFRRLKVKKDRCGRAFVLSEYGGFAWCVKGHSFSEGVFGYRNYTDHDSLNKGYRRLMDSEIMPLVKKGLSAAVYTQLSDIEEEVNGLMTYDRKVVKIKAN